MQTKIHILHILWEKKPTRQSVSHDQLLALRNIFYLNISISGLAEQPILFPVVSINQISVWLLTILPNGIYVLFHTETKNF